ncbi:MAG: hypothetical protein ACXVCM_03570 [Ktedonobacteraceae bacterium]
MFDSSLTVKPLKSVEKVRISLNKNKRHKEAQASGRAPRASGEARRRDAYSGHSANRLLALLNYYRSTQRVSHCSVFLHIIGQRMTRA